MSSTREAPVEGRIAEWLRYRLYGLTLASDFAFANRLVRGGRDPDLTFSCVGTAPTDHDWMCSPPVFATAPGPDHESLLYLYRHSEYDVLRYTDVADFYLWPERIICHLLDPAYDFTVEIYLLGLVLSLWLERRGVPVLHASAVSVADRASVFLAGNQGGKTSLAAALTQDGYPLLTDDILSIENVGSKVIGHPGYPQMRMWPDEAEHFFGNCIDLERVHPAVSKLRVPVGDGGLGSFCETARPLACLYLPARRQPSDPGTDVTILPLSPANAVMELVRCSFSPNIVWALGLQRQRFALFSRIAGNIPTRRVVYPSGLEHLPAVRDAILEDLRAL